MPQIESRPFVRTDVPPRGPGIGASIGAGLEELGAVGTRIAQAQSAQEIADIRLQQKIDQLQIQQSEKMARSEALRDVTVKHKARIEALQGIEAQAREAGDFSTLTDDMEAWENDFDGKQMEGKGEFYQSTFQTLDRSQRTSYIGRAAGIQQAGNLELGVANVDETLESMSGMLDEDPLIVLNGMEGVKAAYIDVGANQAFAKTRVENARKEYVNEYLFTKLSGRPDLQNDFLDTLESNDSTKKILNPDALRFAKDTITNEIAKRDKRMGAFNDWKLTSTDSDLGRSIAGAETLEGLRVGLDEMDVSEVEKFAAMNKWSRQNPVSADYAKWKALQEKSGRTEQERKLKESRDTAIQSLSDRSRRIKTRYDAAMRAESNPESFVPLEKAIGEFADELSGSRSLLSPAEMERFSNVLMYLQRDIIDQTDIRDQGFVSKYWNGPEKERSVYSMVSEFSMETGDSVEETLLINRMYNDARDLGEEGSRHLMDTKEDAQAEFLKIRDKAIKSSLIDMGLSPEQAQATIDTQTIPQQPSRVPVEPQALAQSASKAKELGLTSEEFMETVRDRGVSEEDAIAAFDDAFESVEPTEIALPDVVDEEIEPDAIIVDEEKEELKIDPAKLPRALRARIEASIEEQEAAAQGKTVEQINRERLAESVGGVVSSGLDIGLSGRSLVNDLIAGSLIKASKVTDRIAELFKPGESTSVSIDAEGNIVIKKVNE